MRRGQSLLRPHRLHLYQILANEAGVPHWKVSLAYGIIQTVVAVLAAFLARRGPWAVLAMLVSVFAFWTVIQYWIMHRYLALPKGAE